MRKVDIALIRSDTIGSGKELAFPLATMEALKLDFILKKIPRLPWRERGREGGSHERSEE